MCAKKINEDEDYGMEGSRMMLLFEDTLKEIYWAEKTIIKSLLKMSKKAIEPQLVHVLESHLTESEEQIDKLEKIFGLLGRKPQSRKTEVVTNMMEEVRVLLESREPGASRDAEIILAARKSEHFEIATYSHLCTYARKLEIDPVLKILESILKEEEQADASLASIGESTIQIQARQAS